MIRLAAKMMIRDIDYDASKTIYSEDREKEAIKSWDTFKANEKEAGRKYAKGFILAHHGETF